MTELELRMRTSPRDITPALVLGSQAIEVVRALRMGGVPCLLVSGRGDPARLSRHTRNVFEWEWSLPMRHHDQALAERLVRFGLAQPRPPVLICTSDQPMIFVSRQREVLARAFRIAQPDAALVEALADKAQFAVLAEEHRLPVPPTCILPIGGDVPRDEVDRVGFPMIVKPTVRDQTWTDAVGSNTKAVHVADEPALLELWPRLQTLSGPAVAQRLIAGPETSIVSHHVYVDGDGMIVGEFTGRKIRTIPAEYGHTSALTVTDHPEVSELGRSVVERLGLRGVAKLDFKEAPDGSLHLLEINARFTLWAHPAAHAGVNLPALVHADLTHGQRPAAVAAHTPVDWVHPKDIIAARRSGMSATAWARWAGNGPVRAVWRWDDPLPFAGMAVSHVTDLVGPRSAATG